MQTKEYVDNQQRFPSGQWDDETREAYRAQQRTQKPGPGIISRTHQADGAYTMNTTREHEAKIERQQRFLDRANVVLSDAVQAYQDVWQNGDTQIEKIFNGIKWHARNLQKENPYEAEKLRKVLDLMIPIIENK